MKALATPPPWAGRGSAAIGPVFVCAAGLDVFRSIVVQVATLAQRGEVEEGRGGRCAVVEVGRANNHPAPRDRVRLAVAGSAPLTPILARMTRTNQDRIGQSRG